MYVCMYVCMYAACLISLHLWIFSLSAARSGLVGLFLSARRSMSRMERDSEGGRRRCYFKITCMYVYMSVCSCVIWMPVSFYRRSHPSCSLLVIMNMRLCRIIMIYLVGASIVFNDENPSKYDLLGDITVFMRMCIRGCLLPIGGRYVCRGMCIMY